MHVEAARDQTVDHMLNLRVRRALLHHNDHIALGSFPSTTASTKSVPPRDQNILCYFFSFPAPSACIASRSADRASSIIRSNNRRIAASERGPEFTFSAFSRTSRSRSGWYSGKRSV